MVSVKQGCLLFSCKMTHCSLNIIGSIQTCRTPLFYGGSDVYITGLLVSLEEEIVNFFKEWPQSIYVSKLSSSYERMMLHALCQYLDLISKSYDCDGLRQTQVENPRPQFAVPQVLLTQYLEQSRSS